MAMRKNAAGVTDKREDVRDEIAYEDASASKNVIWLFYAFLYSNFRQIGNPWYVDIFPSGKDV